MSRSIINAARSVALKVESLEGRRLLSGVSTSIIAGSNLYTIVDNADTSQGNDLYASNLDGSNQRLVHHWDNNREPPIHPFAFGDKLLFDGSQNNIGVASWEPWVSDGTAAGTHVIQDLYESGRGSDPSEYHLVNGLAVFEANHNSVQQRTVYATDGVTIHALSSSTYPYYGPARNVTYSSTAVTWESYSSGGYYQKLSSDGVNTQTLYTEPQNGVIVVQSTNSPTVSLVDDGNGFFVLNNYTQTYKFRKADVTSIQIDDSGTLDAVDQTITIDPDIALPVTINSNGGNDTISTGSGPTTLVLSNRYHGFNATNTQLIPDAANVHLTTDGGNVAFSASGLHLTIHGKIKSLSGTTGNDTIVGSARAETLNGGGGDDVIVGNGGPDNIDGSAGADTIYRGDANDTIVADSPDVTVDDFDHTAADRFSDTGGTTVVTAPTINARLSGSILRVDGTDSADAITFTVRGDDLIVSIGGVSKAFPAKNVSTLIVRGGAGDDTIDLRNLAYITKVYGEAGNDTIYGGSGKDRIYGGDGNDWISGGDNHDTLYGEAGDDRLFGDGGHDYLVGGSGVNVLRGGASVDHLIYTLADDIHANVGDKLTIDSIVG